MTEPSTIAVIGGTGHFGARICRRLLDEPNTKLVVTSRSLQSAQKFVASLLEIKPAADVCAVQLDQSAPSFERDLGQLSAQIVVHTAGPYQGQDYRVATACIRAGSHYIDLADGREFVQGIGQLNELALEHKVLAVAGASTLPGLSSAVIDSVRDQFAQLREIQISIAPAHQTPRGPGTIGAVLSYCGQPFKALVEGQWVTQHGWQNLKLQRYAQLGRRLSAACDVPDLALLPVYAGGAQTVTFHASLEAPWEQLSLWCMAGLTRLRLVPDWSRCVGLFGSLSRKLLWMGSTTGGMQMRMTGTDATGEPKTLVWDLLARNNHGPEIPCSPALILARQLARNEISLRGAHPCLGLISLEAFGKEVENLNIQWQLRPVGPPS